MQIVNISLIAVAAVAAWWQVVAAQGGAGQPGATPPQQIKVCSLLPKEEVKKHLPWNPVVDSMEPEEQPVGAAGSSCNYPSVFIQVLGRPKNPGPPSKDGSYEPISGIGEEAYFRNNRNRYAELLVRSGHYTLTLQANADGKVEAVKPRVISLAHALIAKLR